MYSLGRPEPSGNDLWFDLTPRFDTTRSALGIHRCFPGTGCICIPERADTDALASWVKATGIRSLKVVNRSDSLDVQLSQIRSRTEFVNVEKSSPTVLQSRSFRLMMRRPSR